MDPVQFHSALRDLDMFLSQGASIVPEQVYDRSIRRHVDRVADRTPLEPADDLDPISQGEAFAFVKLDFRRRKIRVERIKSQNGRKG